MRLLPMMLLAMVAGVALVYAPLLSTGTAPSFVKQFTPTPTGGNNVPGYWTYTNDTGKSVGEDRMGYFESNVLKIEPSSPSGVLLGPSVAVILGLLGAIVSYIIVKKGFV
jgi:hypothetical protein